MASATIAKSNSHSQGVVCTQAARGHGRVTRAQVSACRASSYRSRSQCPAGSSVLLVKVGKDNVAMHVGRKPVNIGTHHGSAALDRACGIAPSVVTTVPPTASAPTTTTTQPPPPPTTTTTRPPPPPTTTTTYAPPPTTAAPVGCHPLTDGGNCYEPGEFCRDSDHGATGVAGDGETITCEDNDGWRWEPT
jgi:hypothetical protein